MSGVGNDPRGEARRFNPVKQAWEYDPRAEYVKYWIPELRLLEHPGEAFQAWTVPEERRQELGLDGLEWVERPLCMINFVTDGGRHHGSGRRPRRPRGGSGGASDGAQGSGARSRGGQRRQGGGARYEGSSWRGRGGRGAEESQARTSLVDGEAAPRQGDDAREQTGR